MRKKLLIMLTATVLVGVPAVGLAEKFKTRITIQTHEQEYETRIFGVVRSPEIACEKRREVRLFGPDKGIFKGEGDQHEYFRRYALTQTNRFGEYEFEGHSFSPKGENGSHYLPPGDYFTRALRKDFPGDVCRRDDSQIVTISHDQPQP